MQQIGFQCGQAVWRQFHDKERFFLVLEHGVFEDHANQDRQSDAGQVQAEDDGPGVLREEDRCEQYIYRQPGTAAHEGHQQTGKDAVFLAFEGTRGVDCRYGASNPTIIGRALPMKSE